MAAIKGTIKDTQDNPLEGIEVTAMTDISSGSETVVGRTTTSSLGEYIISGLDSTPVMITAREDRGVLWTPDTPKSLGNRVESVTSIGPPKTNILQADHENLIGYYKLEDLNVTDESVKANHGTVTGTPTNEAVRVNNGVRFNGIDENLTLPFISEYNADIITFSFFSSNTADGTNPKAIVYKGSSTNSVDREFSIHYNGSNFIVATLGNHPSPLSVGVSDARPDGQVDHVIVTFIRTGSVGIKAWINGEYQGEWNSAIVPLLNTAGIYLGRNGDVSTDRYLNGVIDELRIFDRELTQDEVDDLAAETSLVSTKPYVFQCTTSGTTGSTEPSWNPYGTTNDGSVVWTAKNYFRPKTHGPVIAEEGVDLVPLILRPTNPDLVAFWTFDDIVGSNLPDNSGNGYDGIITNATTVVGKNNSALDFSGNPTSNNPPVDYVTIPTIQLGTGSYTISFWFKLPADIQTHTIVSHTGSSPYLNPIALEVTSANNRLYIGHAANDDPVSINMGDNTANTNWNHCILYRSGNTAYTSLNGGMFKSVTLSGSSTTTDFQFNRIGMEFAQNYGNHCTGMIDQFRIFNRLLTAQEHSDLYTEFD